jgi:hypothetical protein
MPLNPLARVAPTAPEDDDLEAGVTLAPYGDAWGADAPMTSQSDDEVVRVPHLELRALPEPAPSTSRSYDTASTRRLPSARRKREQREKGRGKRAHAAPACGSVARRMTGDAPVPTAAFVPPAPPVQSPKSGLAARLARVSDDIILTEAALDAAASAYQPLSPSVLHCQVVDKHERMERKKAARRRKREEATQGSFSTGPAQSVLKV